MHEKFYARLLRLYPAAWREEFGVEMREVFADALHAAQRRGGFAVLRLWWREIVSVPTRGFHPIVAAAMLLIVGWVASDLVANAGLFHTTSLVMLAIGIVLSGFVFGIGYRTAAMTLITIAIAASFGADRLALRFATPGVTSTLTIPGVRVDVSRVDSPSTYQMLIDRAKLSTAPRVRTTTFARDGSLYLTVVRSGGVDGAYALLTMLILAGTATAGRRLATN